MCVASLMAQLAVEAYWLKPKLETNAHSNCLSLSLKHLFVEIDDCDINPCAAGSTCQDKVDGFFCVCADGFEGAFCGVDIDDCAVDPCIKGNCVDQVAGFTCENCDPGYTGSLCETGNLHILIATDGTCELVH